VLMVLAVLSAIGGFVSVPHFLEPMLPLPKTPEALHHVEMPLLVLSVVIAVAGVALASFVYRGGLGKGQAIATRYAGVYRLLANKYWVDEAYERFIGGPLVWLSDRVFLRLGDRVLLDGTLNGMARLAQRVAGGLSRVQTGSLHRYVFFVLLGSLACLAWSFRHG